METYVQGRLALWAEASVGNEVRILETDAFWPIGVCAFYLEDDDVWFFPVVAIERDHQGSGLARHLFDECLEEVAQRTPDGYAKWKVDKDNVASHRLSLGVGARPDPIAKGGRLFTYYLKL